MAESPHIPLYTFKILYIQFLLLQTSLLLLKLFTLYVAAKRIVHASNY